MWWIQCMPCMSLSIVYRKAIDQRAAAPPGTGQYGPRGPPGAPGAESDHRDRDPARRRPGAARADPRPAPRARRPDARARPAGAGRGRPGAAARRVCSARVINNPRTSYGFFCVRGSRHGERPRHSKYSIP